MEIWKVASTRVSRPLYLSMLSCLAVLINEYQPGVAIFTALLSKAQSIIRTPVPNPMNPQQLQTAEPAEIEQWYVEVSSDSDLTLAVA